MIGERFLDELSDLFMEFPGDFAENRANKVVA